MELKYSIEPKNLKVLEIKQITLNKDKFGSLTFDVAYPILHELRKVLVEYEELGYEKKLTKDEVNQVNQVRKSLLSYIKQIDQLDPKSDATFNVNRRNQIEAEIVDFCERQLKELRANLVYLRQEVARNSTDQTLLEEKQKAVAKAQEESEEILSLLQKKLDELNERDKQVEQSSGQIGAKILEQRFKTEIKEYSRLARNWFWAGVAVYLLILVVLGVVIYNHGFGNDSWKDVSWQEVAAKIVFLAALWYAASFAVKNYRVNSHLVSVNRHRAAVAGTLEDFLASGPEHTGEMLREGTSAMFKHTPIGFIYKSEVDSSNSIFDSIRKLIER